jgi:hypothetical protein
MDRVFNTKKEQDKKFADFLRKNGYSEDEIKSLEDADKLNTEIYDKFGGSKAIGDILKESSEYKTIVKLSNGLELISYPYGYAISDGYTNDRLTVRGNSFVMDDGRFKLSNKDKEKINNLIKKKEITESIDEKVKESIEIGKTYTFKPIMTPAMEFGEEEKELKEKDGSPCKVKRKITEKGGFFDAIETVYEVQFRDGSLLQAYEDELVDDLNESRNLKEKTYYDHNLGVDVGEFQEWVDYDMERYGRISVETRRKLRNAGLTLVRDQYGDYEVIADEPIHTRKNRYDKRKYDDELDEAVDEPVDEKNKGLGLKFI